MRMKHMVLTSNKMKAKILNLLYEDELLNVFLIQAIENANEEDEIYINKVEEGISSISNDYGNGHFNGICPRIGINYRCRTDSARPAGRVYQNRGERHSAGGYGNLGQRVRRCCYQRSLYGRERNRQGLQGHTYRDTGGPINSGSNGFIERKGRGHKGII